MAKQIARLLRTNAMADIDVPAIAQFLQSQGRRGDSVLAHINPQEAALLKKMGGAETVNPVTGLPEYFKIEGDYAYGADYGNANQRAQQVADAGFNETADLGQFDLPEFDYTYEVPAGGEIPFNATAALQAPLTTGYSRAIPEISSFPAITPEADIRNKNLAAATQLDIGQIQEAQARIDKETAKRVAEKYGLDEGRTIGKTIDDISKSTGLSREALGRPGLAGLGTIQE